MVLVSVWYLEHDGPDPSARAAVDPRATRLIRVLSPSPGLAPLFYRDVGESCRWRGRLSWDHDTWARELRRPGSEWWLFWRADRPVGFAELHGGQGPDRAVTHIKYLGLLPDARGDGLGTTLLAETLRQAWRIDVRHHELPPVRRVTVETCEWDSSAALPNYLARGFRIVRTEKQVRRSD